MNLATLNPAQSSRLAAAALRRNKLNSQSKVGAPFGNKNAVVEHKRNISIHMRVKGEDKRHWVKAANLAVRNKTLEPDARGNLANWVIVTLNAAADAMSPRAQR